LNTVVTLCGAGVVVPPLLAAYGLDLGAGFCQSKGIFE